MQKIKSQETRRENQTWKASRVASKECRKSRVRRHEEKTRLGRQAALPPRNAENQVSGGTKRKPYLGGKPRCLRGVVLEHPS
jgi:hypothetical protein